MQHNAGEPYQMVSEVDVKAKVFAYVLDLKYKQYTFSSVDTLTKAIAWIVEEERERGWENLKAPSQTSCSTITKSLMINLKNSKPLYKQQNYPKAELSHGFLELGAYQDIYVSVVHTPHMFFVQKANIISCLEDLVNDINVLVTEGKLEKETRLSKGVFCIAPFDQDGRWYRAKVQQILSNSSDNMNNDDDDDVRLFFVDFGDEGSAKRKEIFRITEKQLLLPAQAIECSLVNLVPPHGGWSEQAGDAFWEKTLDDNVNKRLIIKDTCTLYPSLNVIQIDQLLNTYNVCLYDTVTQKDIDIAEELVKEGWGRLADVQNCDVNQNGKIENNLNADLSSETNSAKESSGTEEDLLHEESEAAGKFLGFIAKKFIDGILQNSKLTQSTDEEEEIVKQNHNPSVSRSFKPSLSSPSASKDSPSLSIPSDIPPLVAVEGITKSFTPHICWWQNKSHVIVTVQLTGVKEYDLTLSHTRLQFCTQWEGRLYRFDEELFASINPNGSKANTSDKCVIIELEKSSFGERWTRLVKTIKKRSHIQIDFDHLDTSSSDEDSFVKGLRKAPDEGGEKGEILPVDPSDIEDQNDACSDDDPSDENVFEHKDPFDILS
ncbi:uncharacterized protein LOC106466048 [Limulus polyphemus]|uniref:Uncharacterized protein LOC106466048 n=1 Tax=Limulus polyphemus TaxID=6850 RepID=A0ABM1T1F5_LIMPO|nr:uncharacterized protein LOC106466048 [Limulus polyphemus]